MIGSFKVYHLIQERYWDDEDVYIGQDGRVYWIEERNQSYETYMYKEDITDKVRIEWING